MLTSSRGYNIPKFNIVFAGFIFLRVMYFNNPKGGFDFFYYIVSSWDQMAFPLGG